MTFVVFHPLERPQGDHEKTPYGYMIVKGEQLTPRTIKRIPDVTITYILTRGAGDHVYLVDAHTKNVDLPGVARRLDLIMDGNIQALEEFLLTPEREGGMTEVSGNGGGW